MQLEKQVCSLELSKRLRELGVKQESVFYWIGKTLCLYNILEVEMAKIGGVRDFYSAFTVAELGEMLPHVNQILDAGMFGCDKLEDGWECSFSSLNERREFLCKTEADARANALIYLLENKLISNE